MRLAGESGEGVISSGDILTTGAARAGYWALTFRTYPAEIKGGPCMYQVRIGVESVLSQGDSVDLLVCFNQEAFDLHHQELADDGHLVCDAESVRVTPEYESRSSEVALGAIAQESGGNRRGKNMVSVGLVCGLLGVDTARIEEMILKRYAHKGDVGESNIRSLRAGFEHARDDLPEGAHRLDAPQARPRTNACSCRATRRSASAPSTPDSRYYAGYPITPASDILEWLAARLPRFGGVAIQTEDEIAALASVLGASYAGKKAMTATSGPGLSLMAELVGLAGMAEIPAVIVDAQRSGPVDGHAHEDRAVGPEPCPLRGHGEAPRVVMAPTSVDDCFHIMVDAFNAAEKYQVPVIVLSDQSLSHRLETIARPDPSSREVDSRVTLNGAQANGSYQRYLIRDDGISPMAVPGGPGAYVSTGIEHDEAGHPRYEPELHTAMMAKRFRKLDPLAAHEGRITTTGPAQADVGILGWGSTEGAAIEAARICLDRGLKVATCYPRVLAPLPVERIREWAQGMKRIVVPELNVTSQFARLVRSDVGIEVESVTKATGLPFATTQIADFITDGTPPGDDHGVWGPGREGEAIVG